MFYYLIQIIHKICIKFTQYCALKPLNWNGVMEWGNHNFSKESGPNISVYITVVCQFAAQYVAPETLRLQL